MTVKEPVTLEVVQRHLRGEICLGAHPVGPDGECRWIGWEADSSTMLRPILSAAKSMFPEKAMLVHSTGGRSFHVKVFFNRPIRAEDAYLLAKKVAEGAPGVEFYPKQAKVGEGFGNFMRVPLGRHGKTGEKGALIQPKSLSEIVPCPPPDWCAPIFKFFAAECTHRVKEVRENKGNFVETGLYCCLYFDGTVGYCDEACCPIISTRSRLNV